MKETIPNLCKDKCEILVRTRNVAKAVQCGGESVGNKTINNIATKRRTYPRLC